MARWNSVGCTHQLPLPHLLLLLVLLLEACLAVASPSASSASSPSVVPGHVRRSGKGFVWDCTGNCEHNVVTKTTPGAVLMGGGVDVDEAFLWQIRNSAGGDFLILRTHGSEGYNSYVWELAQKYAGGINSVATIITTSREGANDPFVSDKIRNAEALFIAGGDQDEYLARWTGTNVQRDFQYLIDKGVTIGGTSAGLAVQGQFIYTGEQGSVTSAEALHDPYNRNVTLATGFLREPFLERVITDSHFYQMDRMGRSLTFLARLLQDRNITSGAARGIAVSEATAVLLDQNGLGKIVNDGQPGFEHAAYFLETTRHPERCERGKPLSIKDIAVHRVEMGNVFDVKNWKPVTKTKRYWLGVDNGKVFSKDNDGDIY